MTVRGGGFPTSPLAFMPIGRMGPPLRSFAADAHDCIVVRVLGPTGYKVVARFEPRPKARSPSDRHSDRTQHLNLLTKKAPYKGLGADSEEKHEPVSDIDTAAADSLKVLDPKRPIREADSALQQYPPNLIAVVLLPRSHAVRISLCDGD